MKVNCCRNASYCAFIQSSILNLTRKLIPPIGGVDVGPVIWIGVISFLREILVGQQWLIKLALHTHVS